MQEGAVQDLNLIVKADVRGLGRGGRLASSQKIQHPEVRVNVIHTGVGGITESDVMLASASNAIVVGFNVRPNAEARALAEREGVEIRTYRVIYQLTEDIEQALVGMLSPVTTRRRSARPRCARCSASRASASIAGCYVTSGVVRRNAQVRVVRDGTVVYETTISQLKRFKDDVREVQEGFECGILLEGFNDVKEGDVLEVYETRADRAHRPERRARHRRTVRPASRGRRLRRHPLGRAPLPRGRSLKGKRKDVQSAKAQLQNRFGASVAEVDHHDLWQRARLTLACVAREHREVEGCSTRRRALPRRPGVRARVAPSARW